MHPNPTLFVESLNTIYEGTVTFDDFKVLAGIKSTIVADEILKFLLGNGIGRHLDKRLVSFSSTDRLKASMLAIKLGGDILNIAQHLSWRDFEMFASEILLNSGFLTLNNVRFTKPRAEIDIVATKSHLGLSIDCKHWSNNGRSALVEHIRRQHQRTKRLLGSDIKFKKVVPLLLTIYPNFQPYNPNLVTVVDINNFTTFVNEIESHIDQVLCLSRD